MVHGRLGFLTGSPWGHAEAKIPEAFPATPFRGVGKHPEDAQLQAETRASLLFLIFVCLHWVFIVAHEVLDLGCIVFKLRHARS